MGAAAAEWFTVEVFAIGTVLLAMQLITILNRCHRFRGFAYEGAGFSPTERNIIEVRVRPRKGSAAICSGCHRPPPVTTISPSGTLSSFPYGASWSFSCTKCAE